MKTLIAALAILIQVSLHSQTTPVSKRFLGEEYRLFLPGEGLLIERTDQIYTVDFIENDDIYVIENNALKFVCDFRAGIAEVYFDGKFDSEYSIQLWDCYNFFVIKIPLARTSYHFFRIYSLDKTW